jgi:integrase
VTWWYHKGGQPAGAQSQCMVAIPYRDGKGPNTIRGGSEELRLPGPTDLIFPKWQRELFKAILEEENLRVDREGRPRTAYSLRHTYICLHLMEGADIYQMAKNCRTSVEMIEKYYAAHIKTNLDAAAINIMRPKPKKIGKSQPRRENRPGPSTPETDV